MIDALLSGREGLGEEEGARLVVVATDGSFESVRARALAHLQAGAPAGPGIHFRERPVSGELAFVFTGAGAAYRGMGRDLLERLPGLADSLARRSVRLPRALAWSFDDDSREPTVLEQLWGASALCQLHAELTLGLLGMTPDAWMGYSSGETNALLASGTWTDADALVAGSESSGIFTRDLGGSFAAVERAWSGPVRWASWALLAPVADVTDAIASEANVHLAVVHGDEDCVVSGDEEGCARVVEKVGRSRALRLGYPLAVHVPELDVVRQEWLSLHRRQTTPPVADGSRPAARFYTNATGRCYAPNTESCAEAILGQANRTLDLRPTVLAAWEDGVRVFVEHGPQAACGRWVRAILGEREALVVSLDRKGQGLEATLEALAALVAAGVPMRAGAIEALDARLRGSRPSSAGGRKLAFEGHPPRVAIPPVPAPGDGPRPGDVSVMVPAPALPPVLDDDWGARRRDVVVPAVVPVEPAPAASSVPAAPAGPSPASPLVSSQVLESFRSHVARLSQLQQDHVLAQQALHERFLSMRGAAVETFLHAARRAGTTESGPVAATDVAPPIPVVPGIAPAAPPSPDPAPVEKPRRGFDPVGPRFDRRQLEVHAGGRISEIFGPQFAAQDRYDRQVRMPLPPLLLADRVVGLSAEPASMGKGTIWTETDVTWDSWYLHQGHMPPGLMIEAGQADLMLISYLGVDLLNRGERVYRLLGCELTWHGDLPRAGDTLRFGIHLDGHAAQGPVRLMFFHYDCTNGDRPQLTVRKGQAGFFTDAELAESAGCLWSPEEQAIVPEPRLAPPAVRCGKSRFGREALEAFSRGDAFACFGAGFERAKTHTRGPRIPEGRMLLQDRVTDFDASGGPWGRGYLRAELDVKPDLWFFDGHFKNDPCMPGTLMFDGCLQAMSFYLAALGFTLPRDGWRFRPVAERPYQLQCRGQVTPSSRRLVTEVFVEEVVGGPVPTLFADLLCTVDGLKAFHARRVAIELVPDWPLEAMPKLLAEAAADTRPVAEADGFRFDRASLLACAWGKPSKAFGPIYSRFDGPTRVARLPGPPYLFMSRVTEVDAPIGVMKAGATTTVEYDVPADAWYFDENGCRTMPFAVLLEAALQPCGWLSSYVGSALSVDEELGFRNLDGTGRLLGEVFPDSGTLTTRVRLNSVSATGTMIIVSFEVLCSVGERPVYEMKTVFGFFPPASLASQAGLPILDAHRELLGRPGNVLVDLTARPPAYFDARRPRLAGPMLLMLDRVDGLWPEAGKAGLGQMRAVKDVDAGEWFFKAHFFQDPVQPGSLGIEAMIQALQLYMLEARMDDGIVEPRFESLGTGTDLTWKYRGQVLPHHRTVHTTIEITAKGRDERGAWATCEASLWADGQRIYEATNLGMRIVPGRPDPGSRPCDSAEREIVLDPERDRWLLDHRPTWTEPALPMMSMVDLLARGSTGDGPVTGLRDLRVSGWFLVGETRRLRCEEAGGTVKLLALAPEGEKEVARARVLRGNYGARPDPLPEARGAEVPLPYETGALFHGPAFQVAERLVTGKGESSSLLRGRERRSRRPSQPGPPRRRDPRHPARGAPHMERGLRPGQGRLPGVHPRDRLLRSDACRRNRPLRGSPAAVPRKPRLPGLPDRAHRAGRRLVPAPARRVVLPEGPSRLGRPGGAPRFSARPHRGRRSAPLAGGGRRHGPDGRGGRGDRLAAGNRRGDLRKPRDGGDRPGGARGRGPLASPRDGLRAAPAHPLRARRRAHGERGARLGRRPRRPRPLARPQVLDALVRPRAVAGRGPLLRSPRPIRRPRRRRGPRGVRGPSRPERPLPREPPDRRRVAPLLDRRVGAERGPDRHARQDRAPGHLARAAHRALLLLPGRDGPARDDLLRPRGQGEPRSRHRRARRRDEGAGPVGDGPRRGDALAGLPQAGREDERRLHRHGARGRRPRRSREVRRRPSGRPAREASRVPARDGPPGHPPRKAPHARGARGPPLRRPQGARRRGDQRPRRSERPGAAVRRRPGLRGARAVLAEGTRRLSRARDSPRGPRGARGPRRRGPAAPRGPGRRRSRRGRDPRGAVAPGAGPEAAGRLRPAFSPWAARAVHHRGRMRRLAVVHHRHEEWVSALREAETRLDIRGFHPRDPLDDAWLASAEGLFVWKIPEGLIARMPLLVWIQSAGAGVDHLLADPSIPARLPVTRADGQFGLWMARYTLGHLLAPTQRLDECREAQAERRWAPKLLPEDLTGQVALVLGFGRIGRQIGRALREIGLDVQGFVRSPRSDAEFPLHGIHDLEAWLPRARVLVLCAPLTPETRGLVDANLLGAGHPRLVLVNVARGDLVVTADLLEALDAGRLERAVLDVFAEEPLPTGSPLWSHPKVVVTPHHSGPSTPRAMVPDVLENLRRFAEGRPVVDPVDRTRGY